MDDLVVFADGTYDSASSIHGIGICIAKRCGDTLTPLMYRGYPVSVVGKSTVYELELLAMIEAIRIVSSMPHQERVLFLTDNTFVVARFADPYGKTSLNPMLCHVFAKLLDEHPWVTIQHFRESEVSLKEGTMLRNIADYAAVTARKGRKQEEANEFPLPQILKGV